MDAAAGGCYDPLLMTNRTWTLVILVATLALGAIWGARYVRDKRATSAAVAAIQGTAEAEKPGTVRLFREPAAVAPFDVTDLSGRTWNSSEWKGKVVLVNFWATWCPPCRAEIPELIKLQERYRDKLVIVGISDDEGPAEDVQRFVTAQGMNYIVAMGSPQIRKLFHGVVALPTTFVLDLDGRIAQKHVGMLNAANTELETRVLAGLDTTTPVERVDNSDKVRLANAAQARNLPGVDLSGFTEEQRKPIMQALIDATCTCGCSLTVAECRLEDPACPISLPIAKDIVKKFADAR